MRIAVVGTGIAGLSAAWLLAKAHDVTVFEQDVRTGGHCNTVTVSTADGLVAVDTGFIVCNPETYPNLMALFDHLSVETVATTMSFSVSIKQDGARDALEYSGSSLRGLVAQPANLVRPRFWSMLRDLVRLYREAPTDLAAMGDLTLGEYLASGKYGAALRDDHLYPMAGAIWSTPTTQIADVPARTFVAFCQNHGLFRLWGRPTWRTVSGGSRQYVSKLLASGGTLTGRVHVGTPVMAIRRTADGVHVQVADTAGGHSTHTFDHVVVGAHADQALTMLADPDDDERRLLGQITYRRNETVLHTDARLMPRRRAAWASWNARMPAPSGVCVTYWMNRLQALPTRTNLFVTLGAPETLAAGADHAVHATMSYAHPILDARAVAAQASLWSLQGRRRTWFCGAWFGAGFHEDALQAGLAVAEQLGGVRRPWQVANPSGRIHVGMPQSAPLSAG
jgi:predicted NAD/FAD-binding protein